MPEGLWSRPVHIAVMCTGRTESMIDRLLVCGWCAGAPVADIDPAIAHRRCTEPSRCSCARSGHRPNLGVREVQRRYCDLSLAEVIARDPADEHTTPAVTAIEQEMIHEMTTTEIASLAATRKAARAEAEALSAAKLREVLKAAGRKLPRSKAEGIEALVTLRVEQRAAALKAAKAAAKTAENAGRNERRNARRAEKAAAGKPLAGPTLLDKHEGEHGTLVPKAKVRLHSTLTRTTKEAGGRFTIAKGTTGTLKKLILRGRGVTAVVAIRGEGERNIPVRYLEPVA